MNIDSNIKEKSKEGRYVLLFGGAGYERDVSILGAHGFLKCAEEIGFDFLPIFISENGDFYIFSGKADDVLKINRKRMRGNLIPTTPLRIEGKAGFLLGEDIIGVKLVFPLLHGDFGEDGVIQGLLSALGMKFVGADSFTGSLAADKVYSKIVARSVGVKTLPETVASRGQDLSRLLGEIEGKYGFPVFVKPARLGSSIGASLVKSKQEFSKSLKKAFSVSKRVMIEPAVMQKRELECAYYDIGGKRIITPPAEVSIDGGFYNFDLKYKNAERVGLIPRADISDVTARVIREYTERLADAFCVRHIARFDYFLLSDGSVIFNEVNTMPGMTRSSLYLKMLAGLGIEPSDFILSLKEIAD